MDRTILDSFGVLAAHDDTEALHTVVEHMVDTKTGYELITIAQTNEDGSIDCVCVTRADILRLQLQLKGH